MWSTFKRGPRAPPEEDRWSLGVGTSRHTLIPTGRSHLAQTGASQSESASFKTPDLSHAFPVGCRDVLMHSVVFCFFCFFLIRSAAKIETSCLQSDADFRLLLIFRQMGIKTLIWAVSCFCMTTRLFRETSHCSAALTELRTFFFFLGSLLKFMCVFPFMAAVNCLLLEWIQRRSRKHKKIFSFEYANWKIGSHENIYSLEKKKLLDMSAPD